MKVEMVMQSKDVFQILLDLIKDNLLYDITARTGYSNSGLSRVAFTIKGSTQEEIWAKIDALETVIDKLQRRRKMQVFGK